MAKMNKITKLMTIGVLCFGVTGLFGTQKSEAALTGTTNLTQVVTAGSLTIFTTPTATAFGNVNLNGSAQNVNSDLGALHVQDFTGSGAGWNVTASATQFTSGGDTIPTGSLLLKVPNNPTAITAGGVVPSTKMGSNTTIDGGSVKVISAAVAEGLGEFQLTFPANSLTLNVPSTTKVGTYTSTITWTLSVGP